MNSDLKTLSPFIALSSAIIFAVIIWFVLTRFVGFNSALAAGIGMLFGATEYFVLRYVFSMIAKQQDHDL